MSFFTLRKGAALLALSALMLGACQPTNPSPENVEDEGTVQDDVDNGIIDENNNDTDEPGDVDVNDQEDEDTSSSGIIEDESAGEVEVDAEGAIDY